MSAVKIRLWGTKGECEVAAARIAVVLDVLSISDPYPDRGRSLLVRVYVEARIPGPAPQAGEQLLRELVDYPGKDGARRARS